jgi:hypothetical protein
MAKIRGLPDSANVQPTFGEQPQLPKGQPNELNAIDSILGISQ